MSVTADIPEIRETRDEALYTGDRLDGRTVEEILDDENLDEEACAYLIGAGVASLEEDKEIYLSTSDVRDAKEMWRHGRKTEDRLEKERRSKTADNLKGPILIGAGAYAFYRGGKSTGLKRFAYLAIGSALSTAGVNKILGKGISEDLNREIAEDVGRADEYAERLREKYGSHTIDLEQDLVVEVALNHGAEPVLPDGGPFALQQEYEKELQRPIQVR